MLNVLTTVKRRRKRKMEFLLLLRFGLFLRVQEKLLDGEEARDRLMRSEGE